MLQDRLGLVLLDGLRHHVKNIVHYCCPEFQVEVGLDTLLRNRLRDSLAIAAFELAGEEVTEPKNKALGIPQVLRSVSPPSFKERNDAPHEEQPYPPPRSPESATRSFTNWASVEAIVDQILEILAHSRLSHQLPGVAVSTSA